LAFTGITKPGGVAVDSAGNVFVADALGNSVFELATGYSRPTVMPFTGLKGPQGVAVDSAGNVLRRKRIQRCGRESGAGLTHHDIGRLGIGSSNSMQRASVNLLRH
jgi:hypothetical protein